MEVLGNGNYGDWIRPVSARPTAEVSYSEYRYQNGGIPQLLDIIDVALLNAAPHNHQSENHVIDATARWVKVGELSWEDVAKLQQRPKSIWINSDHTQAGIYDCMSQATAETLEGSLLLIKPENFIVEVGTNPWNGRKTYRGNFDYRGTHHSLSLEELGSQASC
jgi:putative nucleic acid modification protein with dual OB domain